MRVFLCLILIYAGTKYGFIDENDGIQNLALALFMVVAALQDIKELLNGK